MEKINQKDYRYYVVRDIGDNKKEIQSGWEYQEDAKDARKDRLENYPHEKYDVFSLKTLKALNIDPDNNSNWGETENKPKESYQTKIIRGGLSQETYRLLIRRTKEGKAKYSKQGVENMIREGREFGHMNDEEMNELLLELNGPKEILLTKESLIKIVDIFLQKEDGTKVEPTWKKEKSFEEWFSKYYF